MFQLKYILVVYFEKRKGIYSGVVEIPLSAVYYYLIAMDIELQEICIVYGTFPLIISFNLIWFRLVICMDPFPN